MTVGRCKAGIYVGKAGADGAASPQRRRARALADRQGRRVRQQVYEKAEISIRPQRREGQAKLRDP